MRVFYKQYKYQTIEDAFPDIIYNIRELALDKYRKGEIYTGGLFHKDRWVAFGISVSSPFAYGYSKASLEPHGDISINGFDSEHPEIKLRDKKEEKTLFNALNGQLQQLGIQLLFSSTSHEIKVTVPMKYFDDLERCRTESMNQFRHILQSRRHDVVIQIVESILENKAKYKEFLLNENGLSGVDPNDGLSSYRLLGFETLGLTKLDKPEHLEVFAEVLLQQLNKMGKDRYELDAKDMVYMTCYYIRPSKLQDNNADLSEW